MAWFGGSVERTSSKAAAVFGIIAAVAFITPSVLVVFVNNEIIGGAGVLLSICVFVFAMIGVVVSLIVRVVRKPVVTTTSAEVMPTPAEELMTTPAQPGLPTEEPHQPAQTLPDGPGAPTAPRKPPNTVLAAVAIAVALVGWQVWTLFAGIRDYHQKIGDPSQHPKMSEAHAKEMVDVILGVGLAFTLILVVPLVWGAVKAYRGSGRVLSFAAWLYIVTSIPLLLLNAGGHRFPIEAVLTMLAAAAIIICQRQGASKTYYASHRS
jgi:hypothetical protein